MKLEENLLQDLVCTILASKKYRQIGLNPQTVTDLIQKEAPSHTSEKLLLKAVKRKLHNIIAPYLGEPNYENLSQELEHINQTSLDSYVLRAFCEKVLTQHASTAERIPILSAFYKQLFEAVGKPSTIIDLACGLNPLAFPWMGLPVTTQYFAYDIVDPRVNFINKFFNKIGLEPLAENRDILINPPPQKADLIFFFKEAHRFEKRQPGSNRVFWESLHAKTLAVSLPTRNLKGNLNLLDGHHQLIYHNLPKDWEIREIQFENEIVFLLKRGLL